MRPSDDDLRPLFEETRRADEKGAPPFRRVLERMRAVRAAPLRIGRAVAAAAAVLVFAIALKLARHAPEPPRVGVEAWKPATDFLLEASFTDLFDSTPALPGVVPDYAPLLQKENEQGKKS